MTSLANNLFFHKILSVVLEPPIVHALKPAALQTAQHSQSLLLEFFEVFEYMSLYLRFVLCLAVCCFVFVFFSPFSIVITSLGEERASLGAFRTFV